MQDIKTDIVFGTAFSEGLDIVEQSKHDVIQYRKDQSARDLGMKIAEKKKWYEWEDDDNHYAELRLYVFTPHELHDYLEAMFKAREATKKEDI